MTSGRAEAASGRSANGGLGSVCGIEQASAAEQLVHLLDGARPMPLDANRVRGDKVDVASLLEIVLTPGRDDSSQENNDDLAAAAAAARGRRAGA